MSDYDLLGLEPGASAAEAKRARNKLARHLHPDMPENRNADPSRLADINAALDRILAGKPQLSDKAQAAKPQPRPQGWRDFKDFDAKEATERAKARTDQRANGASHQESPYRRDASGFENRYSRQGQGPRHSRQSHDDTERSDSGAQNRSAKSAARNFYAQARRADAGRQEELRQKAREKAAREASTAEHGGRQAEAEGGVLNASDDRRLQLKEAIEKRKKQEAYRRVTQLRGIYPDPRRPIDTNRGDLPGFHMAEMVRFQGRTMQLHLPDEAKEGRNIIAMPEMEMLNGQTVRQGKGVTLFEVSRAAGQGASNLDERSNPVAGATGLKVEVIFGSELARRKTQDRDARS